MARQTQTDVDVGGRAEEKRVCVCLARRGEEKREVLK